jgi:hypothetical protein
MILVLLFATFNFKLKRPSSRTFKKPVDEGTNVSGTTVLSPSAAT